MGVSIGCLRSCIAELKDDREKAFRQDQKHDPSCSRRKAYGMARPVLMDHNPILCSEFSLLAAGSGVTPKRRAVVFGEPAEAVRSGGARRIFHRLNLKGRDKSAPKCI